MSHTLLMRFAAPMQSWGTKSRFDERDTELEPSKSGVIGLVCAALGVDREEEAPVLELAAMPMGVRVDREGILRRDYHTAQEVIRADGKGVQDTAVSNRYYLADAVFLVGLESPNRAQLEDIQAALKNPVWPLSFGRKSFVPSQPVWLEDGLRESDLEKALWTYPHLTSAKPTRIVLEANRGSLRMDNPISSFAKRRFGARFVESKTWEEFYAPE
ncbi:MAG: type I-E CRISPR-associated protein Cas5/CasD [Thermaceae bacterium]|nr:type I-E CRISPR-associated protein Cas5/CasD [Thermaceae bacterium]